ncbi:hypothetical protein A5712_27840 [Mycobacterium sp. E2327]|uniref:AMP-binding protein n=1 Tax=Mycobacterium sp. E2327 TaxID=1834132 RepID=UPI0008009E1C|nr:AMP-binding protein [Mycobacterium sp. E2327]OBI15766.1 hypothetical protein A5712_27840 [Mycobacterium sp. E2327]
MHNVAQAIQSAILRYGDAIALDDGESTYTFTQLGDITDRLVSLYRELGLRRGDRVVMLQRNSINFVLTEIALYRAGIARVAVNARLRPQEYAYIIGDSGAKACIHDPEFQDGIDSMKNEVACPVWLLSDKVVEEARELAPAGEDPAAVKSEAIALIQYTSGTTGRPKGAVITQSSKVEIDRNTLIELPDLGGDDVMLHVTPLTHASGAFLLPCLLRGVRQIPREFRGAGTFIDWVQSCGVTVSFLVPTIIKMITEETGGQRPPEFSRLKTVIYAGSPISAQNLSSALAVFGNSLLQFYGLSEAQLPIATLRKEDHRPGSDRLGSAGRPVPHVEVQIRGDDGRPLPPGQIGEITTRGPHVMAGYWNNSVATANVIDVDGWLRTGDLGYLDDAYFLHLVDRKNDMIISGGFNVYPLEVEDALCAHPQVADAAVFGIPDDRWGETVAAAVVLRDESTVAAADLEAHCKNLLAGFKCPRKFDFVAAVPRNPAGKLLRRELRDPYWRAGERSIQG